MLYNYIVSGFYSQLGHGEKTNKLKKKNIKWKQSQEKKKDLNVDLTYKSWFDSGWMMNADFIIFTLSSTI